MVCLPHQRVQCSILLLGTEEYFSQILMNPAGQGGREVVEKKRGEEASKELTQYSVGDHQREHTIVDDLKSGTSRSRRVMYIDVSITGKERVSINRFRVFIGSTVSIIKISKFFKFESNFEFQKFGFSAN